MENVTFSSWHLQKSEFPLAQFLTNFYWENIYSFAIQVGGIVMKFDWISVRFLEQKDISINPQDMVADFIKAN